MKLKFHIIVSATVFGFLFLYHPEIGLNFVIIAFFASILVDLDHMLLGKKIGTYNPIEVYKYCMKCKFENKWLLWKWVDIRKFPLHNLFINAILLIFLFPIGIGVLLHNIIDGYEYFYTLNEGKGDS